VVIILALAFYLTGGYEKTGTYWIFSFPPIILFLKGLKRGLVLLLVMFTMIGFSAVLQELKILTLPYSIVESRLLQVTLLYDSTFVFIYQLVQEQLARLVSGQKQNLQALLNVNRQEKQKLSLTLKSIGDGVLLLDKNRRIILVNEIVCKVSGFSAEELLEQDYRTKLRFLYEKTHKENTDFVDSVFNEGVIGQMKERTILISKGNIEIPVADSASPIKDDKGNITGCVVVFRDISKEREIERIKDEFISLASHELRTPLTSNKYYLELFGDSIGAQLNPEQKEFLDQLNKTNDEMTALVNDLLNVSRIESGLKFTITFGQHNLIKIINEVIMELQPIADNKSVTIKKNILDLTEFLAWFDEEKIREVIKNLLSNAIKYSKDNSEVELILTHDDKEYQLEVKDHGMGIPEAQKEHIFEKLFRASNAVSSQTEGTGLGLYITKTVVEGHKGSISFESTENVGTSFMVKLPINQG
jgi:PAS domain S-box-containing protein